MGLGFFNICVEDTRMLGDTTTATWGPAFPGGVVQWVSGTRIHDER
jgi:hypothetical protein